MEAAELRHWAKIKARTGKACVYRRNGVDRNLTLVPASPRRSQTGENDFTVSAIDKTFIGGTAELRDAGLHPPKRDDRITLNDAGGVAETYQVTSDANDDLWRPMGNYGAMVRINAKRVKTT